MDKTDPPTVPDTVAVPDSLLGNADFSTLTTDEPAADETSPAEGEGGGEEKDQADGEKGDETDAEGDSDAAEGDAEGEDEGEAAEPEEKPAATPKPTAAKPEPDPDAEAAQARAVRLSEINAEIKSLRALKKDKPDAFDPFDHGSKLTDLLAEKDELRDAEVEELRQATESVAATARTEKAWQKFERENPDIGAKGRRIWNEELAKAEKEFDHPASAALIANERWKNRIKLVRAKARDGKPDDATPPATPTKPPVKAPAAPAGKPTPTKGGGSVIPKGTGGRPVVQETDPLKQFVAATAGGIRDFMK